MTKIKSSKAKRRGNPDEGVEQKPMRSKSANLRAREAWTREVNNPLVCKNAAQERYLEVMRNNTITLGMGPAGTGKTYVSVKYAAQSRDAGRYQRIVVLRPIVEMGEKLGALPGTVDEKIEPWAEPFLKVLRDHYGAHLDGKLSAKNIEFIPLQHVRGRTFDNAFVILDEAQNTTPDQMKTLLTRLGVNSQLVMNGDLDQMDIRGKSGLADARDVLAGVGSVGVAVFVEEDIVRSDIVRDILIAYRNRAQAQQAAKSQ